MQLLTNEHTAKVARQSEATVFGHVVGDTSQAEQAIANLLTTTTDKSAQVISQNMGHHSAQDLDDRERQRSLGSRKFATMNEAATMPRILTTARLSGSLTRMQQVWSHGR